MKVLARLLVLGLLVMCGGFAYAEEKAAPMDPAMMEKMQKYSMPGEAHKVFEDLTGSWNYASKFQMSPDAPAEETTGTEKREIIHGGRFLKQEVSGVWAGQPFEGIGYTGYDNIKEEYVSVWIDSMATGIMHVSGKYDPTTKTINFSGENSCPLTGEKNHKTRGEWIIEDKNKNTYINYLQDKDGKEFKAMEIVYTRA